MSESQAVLDFWFKPADHPDHGKMQSYWWKKDAAFDDEIKSKFGDLITRALNGELKEDWEKTAESTVAHIVVLDQFARNVYRGNRLSYAGADLAISSTQKLIDTGADKNLKERMRFFVYMPLMHAESLELQSKCIECYEKLNQDINDGTDHGVEFAKKHQEVIIKYGRFPQRNEPLGRESTPEELEYIANGGGF